MSRAQTSTVFLDAGGVLVFPNWRLVSEALARHGVLVDPARLEAADPATKRTLDVGPTVKATNDDQRGFLYFDLILKHAGVQPDTATDAALAELREYHERYGVWDYVPDDVAPAVRRLRAANLQLVVVSNSNGTLRAMLDRVGLLGYFDIVVDSGEEGIEKPDPGIFLRALARAGAAPTTTIHTGDLYEIDIVGARSAGLRGVLIDAAGLYEGVDCPRVGSLNEFVDRLLANSFD
jgi:HAD superfamily hydrolase (TIGR01549 family)